MSEQVKGSAVMWVINHCQSIPALLDAVKAELAARGVTWEAAQFSDLPDAVWTELRARFATGEQL